MSRLSSWGTTPHSARAAFDCAGTGRPRISISPSSGSACAVRSFIVVDLPAPLGPSRPTHVPSGTSRSRWSTAVSGPKRLTTPRMRSAGTPASLGGGVERAARGGGDERLEQRQLLAERLGVPLHAHDEAGALDGLDRAVRRAGDHPPGGGE